MPEPFGEITAYQEAITRHYDSQTFVGREWLIEKVARLRDDEHGRQFIIVGEPGSGKSTFLAYLAESWNCPRHFIRVDSIGSVTGASPRALLVSIGAQLCQKYGPEIFERAEASGTTTVTAGLTKDEAEVVGRFVDELYTLPFLPPAEMNVQVRAGVTTGNAQVIGERVGRLVDVTLVLDESTLLHVAVINPIKKIQELYPKEKVVILLDALDESLQRPGARILDVIPRVSDADFPPNLRLVMTSRPGDHLVVFPSKDLLDLEDEEKGYRQLQLKDARTYVDKRLSQAPFKEIMATWRQEAGEAYATRVADNSEGNFLYLYHFFNTAVEATRSGENTLEGMIVPKGLDEIYRVFAVQKIKADTSLRDWVEVYMPLLGILAVVREAVDRRSMADFAGVNRGYVDYIVGKLEPFLNVSNRNGELYYQLYHRSFAEYLLNSRRNRDFPLDGPTYHEHIVAYYRNETNAWTDWGNVRAGARLGQFGTCDSYLTRHLASHLWSARHKDELYALLTMSSDWMDLKFTACAGDAAYLTDLDLVIGDFVAPLTASEIAALASLYAARQVINARVTGFTDSALCILVWLGRESEALTHARLRSNTQKRLRGLLAIYDALREADRSTSSLLSEIQEMISAIADDGARAEALANLAETLRSAGDEQQAATVLSEALESARAIEHPTNQTGSSLITLTSALATGGRYSEALEVVKVARAIEEDVWEQMALGAVAESLAKAGHYDEALRTVESIKQDYFRGWAQTNVAYAVDEELAGTLAVSGRYEEAAEVVNRSGVSALAAMVTALTEAGQYDAALQYAEFGIDNRGEPEDGPTDTMAGALAATGDYSGALEANRDAAESHPESWASALGSLARALLSDGYYDDALDIARAIEHPGTQVKVLGVVAMALAAEGEEREADAVFAEALETARGIDHHPGERASAVGIVAEASAEAGLYDVALEVINASKDGEEWLRAPGAMAKGYLAAAEEWRRAGERARVLGVVARALAAEGEEREADAVFAEALEMVRAIESRAGEDRVRALGTVAESLVAAGDGQSAQDVLSEALETARAIENLDQRVNALGALAETLTVIDDERRAEAVIDEAREIAHNIESDENYFEGQGAVMGSLAPKLAQAGLHDVASDLAHAIEDDGFRAWVLGTVAEALAVAGDKKRAEAIIGEVLEIVRTIEDVQDIDAALSTVARTWAVLKRFGEALEITRTIVVDHGVRVDALGAVAEALAEGGHYAEALQIARKIEYPTTLGTVAGALATVGRFDNALSVLGVRTLDNYVQTLAQWVMAVEPTMPGVSITTLREITGIVGWARSDWHQIYEILVAAQTETN